MYIDISFIVCTSGELILSIFFVQTTDIIMILKIIQIIADSCKRVEREARIVNHPILLTT